MKSNFLFLLLFPACAIVAHAQQLSADKPVLTGTVSGHVYCADTNAPARMASVMLEPVEIADASHQSGKYVPAAADMEAVKTLLDGSFTIQHVAPGTYYVIVSQPGYISSLASLSLSAGDLQKPDDVLKEKIAKTVPRVTVQANLPASKDITLERGAAVSGTVLFDDGSPATGLEVHLLVHKDGKWASMESGPFETSTRTQTDDRGSYRISGLPAQEYLVEVDLSMSKMEYGFDGHGGTFAMSSAGGFTLPVYSGNSWRPKDAVPFAPKLGEDRTGEDIQVSISKLHSIRGIITAAHDGHTLNGGNVSLLYADDKSVAFTAKLTKDDEAFTFHFVPEGDYILRIEHASDTEYQDVPTPSGMFPPTTTKAHSLHSYGQIDQPIHISEDISALTIAVPDLPAEKAQANR